MNKLYWILILGSISFGFGHGQEKYFPTSHQNIFIGMHMDSLLKIKGTYLEASKSFKGTPQLKEYPKQDTLFTETLYLFTKDSILYEVIIDYKDHFELYAYMKDFYGPPNIEDKEWLIKLENGKELHVWEYINRWCIADGELYK